CACLLPPLSPFPSDCHAHPLHLPSFPTRRSSDLSLKRHSRTLQRASNPRHILQKLIKQSRRGRRQHQLILARQIHGSRAARNKRSEEHTSELQSRFDLVCRLLLEKKKGK